MFRLDSLLRLLLDLDDSSLSLLERVLVQPLTTSAAGVLKSETSSGLIFTDV